MSGRLYANASYGLIDNWLRHLQDVRERHARIVDAAGSEERAVDRLCELNVIEQVRNVCHTTIVQDAWRKPGRILSVHGWIYGLQDGLLRDLGVTAAAAHDVEPAHRDALARF